MLAWNFLTYFHLIHQNIYVKNNLESPDTVVRHPNAFLEYLKPLESVLSRFYFYFHRKKLKNTTNIESLHKFNEDGISTLGGMTVTSFALAPHDVFCPFTSRVPLKSFSLATGILVSLTNIFKMALKCKH